MNVICIMMDTLNRNWLTPYGASLYPQIETPSLERLAARSATFLNHYIGSTPTMPARCDLYSGILELPWRSWGPFEPFNPHLAMAVQMAKTHESHLVSDCAHLWNAGGGFIHTRFDTFELVRGTAGDRWRDHPIKPYPHWRAFLDQKKTRGTVWAAESEMIRTEEEFHGPRVFNHAANWVDKNHRYGPFFLMIDCFDTHEPWDCPEPYRSMYLEDKSLAEGKTDWTLWPAYGPADRYSPEHLAYMRAQYAGTITMADAWLGRLLDTLDRRKLWDDTVILLTADHGFYFGENNFVGKNQVFVRPYLSHIPLLVHWPGSPFEGKACSALSTIVDLHPTILDAMGIASDPRVEGRSLAPVLRGELASVRDACLYGYHGRGLYCADGRWLLCKGEADPSAPLFEYGVHFDVPFWGGPGAQVDFQTGAWEAGEFMPHARRPVFRREARTPWGRECDFDSLFDLESDYDCSHNLWETEPQRREAMLDLLRRGMKEHRFPEEHYARLGL